MVLAARAHGEGLPAACRSMSRATRQRRALPQRQGRRARPAAEGDQHRRGAAAGGGVGVRRADHAGAGGREGLQDRAALLHARRRRGRSDQGEAEPALRRGAEDHRARAAVRPRPGRRLSAGRASRSTTRGWSRRATPARCRGSRTPRSRSIRNSATTASARRSSGGRRTRRCSPWPMWCARCRRAATCCRRPMSRTCIGRIASAAPARARSRSRPK